MDTNWDKFTDCVSEAAETIGAIATDLYEKGKEKVNESKLRNDLRGAYRYLGELVYRQNKGQAGAGDEKITEMIKKIDEILEKLESEQK